MGDDKEKNQFPMVNGGKTLGPPLLEREVSTPLMAEGPKYLEPEDEDSHGAGVVPYGTSTGYGNGNPNDLDRGNTINGVGYGHGRRTPRVASTPLQPYPPTDLHSNNSHTPNPYEAYQFNGVNRSGTPTDAGSFVGVGAGRSMQTVPWAGPGAGAGGMGAGGVAAMGAGIGGMGGRSGAVQGAPGYVPGIRAGGGGGGGVQNGSDQGHGCECGFLFGHSTARSQRNFD